MANVQPIPADETDLGRIVGLVNDRLRRLANGSDAPLRFTGDVDAGGFRIKNLGTSEGLNDAITNAQARRLSGRAGTVTVAAPVEDAPVFLAVPDRS